MKMAKPSAKDIDAATELVEILQAIEGGYGWPELADGPQSLTELLCPPDDIGPEFDPNDSEHLKALYNSLAKVLGRSPRFYNRVIGGMCHVICWEKNRILDPDEACLALHPDLRLGLQLLAEQRASGGWLERMASQAREAVAAQVALSAARHLQEMGSVRR